MGLITRFTRDKASKFVWGSLLLAAILGLVFAWTVGGDAVREERLAAERRSVAYVVDVLAPRLEGVDLDGTIARQELPSLRQAAERSILDERVVRVRIWSSSGALLFSTDHGDEIGSNAALNDELLVRASGGSAVTRWNVSDVGGVDEEGRSLLRTYVPIRAGAVAEIDHAEEVTVGPVASTWLRYQILAAAGVALFLLMSVLSLRDPIERINTGVPFAPSAVPAGYSLIEGERLHAVEEVYRLAHERVARLEQRLAQSEGIRRRLEGDLQRALTSAATGTSAAPATAVAPSSPAAVVHEASRGERDTLDRPRAVRSTARPTPEPATQAPEPSRRPDRSEQRSSRKERRERTERPAAAAAVPPVEPQVGSATERAASPPAAATSAPDVDVVTVPESEVLADAWSAPPEGAPLGRAGREQRRGEPSETDVPAPKPKRQLRRRKVVPAAPTIATPAPDPDVDDSTAHQAALETFIRLTESDRQPHEAGDVDQGAIRAALARTAARKKPGGARLQAHDEPVEEIPGGGPPRDGR